MILESFSLGQYLDKSPMIISLRDIFITNSQTHYFVVAELGNIGYSEGNDEGRPFSLHFVPEQTNERSVTLIAQFTCRENLSEAVKRLRAAIFDKSPCTFLNEHYEITVFNALLGRDLVKET